MIVVHPSQHVATVQERMAPEVLEGDGTTKTSMVCVKRLSTPPFCYLTAFVAVYSYGIVLSEIYTREVSAKILFPRSVTHTIVIAKLFLRSSRTATDTKFERSSTSWTRCLRTAPFLRFPSGSGMNSRTFLYHFVFVLCLYRRQ